MDDKYVVYAMGPAARHSRVRNQDTSAQDMPDGFVVIGLLKEHADDLARRIAEQIDATGFPGHVTILHEDDGRWPPSMCFTPEQYPYP